MFHRTSAMESSSLAWILQCRYDVSKPNSVLMEALENDISQEQCEWLLQEMAENRSKDHRNSKQYSQQALAKALRTGSTIKSHWGTSELIQRLRDNPAVLKAVEHAANSSTCMGNAETGKDRT